MKATHKTLALAIGGAFAASIATTSIYAAENPFALKSLSSGYMVADAGKTPEGKCSTGKCAAGKCAANKAKEASCYAAKSTEKVCGTEASCAAAKAAPEGKCSTGKCAAGKCAANKEK